MEYVPRHSSPGVLPQSPRHNFREEIPLSKSRLSLVAGSEEVRQHSYGPDFSNLNEPTAGFESNPSQGIAHRSRPSATMWRFTLLAGDSILLLVVLELLLIVPHTLYGGVGIMRYETGSWSSKLIWVSFALLSWSIAANIVQCQKLPNISSRLKSPLYTLFALMLMCILWLGISYPFIADDIISYVRFLLFFFMLAVPTFIIWRVLLAEFINLPRFRGQAVIIGDNTAGAAIAKEIRNTKRPFATILGYISESSEEKGLRDGLPILGGRSLLHHIIRTGKLDMIIMAIDHKVNPELLQDAINAVQSGVSVVPMTIAYEQTSGKVPVEHVGDQWYMALPVERNVPLLYSCWQRVMDISFGLFGLLILLLLLPTLGLLIYLDSPGPIFYTQERMGYSGKKFRILKFRSMRTNAETKGHAIWAAKSDSRVTRIGKFMRATHLDELPQVLNILRGDMSLVGPRPEREEFVTHLEKKIPFYHCRLSVKPGLTGWAQVKYAYTSSDDDAMVKVQYDLYYIKHQSFTLDIFIILKTVIEVLLFRGR